MTNRSPRMSSSQCGNQQPPAPTAAFCRRTLSGRSANYPIDDLDSELSGEASNNEYMNYHVTVPPTPDNQPMEATTDPTVSAKVEEQYVSNSIFTSGFNSAIRIHLMDKGTDSEAMHPPMAGVKGSSCAILGCDGKVMSDERGNDILPCECDFKICADCFNDAVKAGGAVCPGCKEPYKATDLEEVMNDAEAGRALPLPPPPPAVSRTERRLMMSGNLNLMKSGNLGSLRKSGLLTQSQAGDWDHSRWLFETKGTYGYGNAIWPRDDGTGGQPSELASKPWRPLTRKLKIPAAVVSPYR